MKRIDFYFDVISPYAYLAFEQLPQALVGISHEIVYKPVLFAGMLKHFGQLGPAEIAPKREWTYRQVQWLAKQAQIAFQMPAAHPFNSLALQRLGLACGKDGLCNRYVAETLFRHVWRDGLSADDPARLEQLQSQLQPGRLIDDPAVKQALMDNTNEAIARGVFGVPSWVVDEQVFWGLDALGMLRQYLIGDNWFATPAWRNAGQTPLGASRKLHTGAN